jgi:RHS repeat-associated protein
MQLRITYNNCITLAYAPFGEILVNEFSGDYDEPYKFTGYERDRESGMDYAHARYKDINLGFISTDPMWWKYPNITPYNYCGNNPIMFVDPDGNAQMSSQRTNFYNTIGMSAIQAAVAIGANNKFKGLYIIAQRRIENGFNPTPPGNNPMNIKSKGDLGYISLMTTEYFNGVRTKLPQNFGNFSSVQKGFEGYIDLLKNNFFDAYNALIDNNKTIVDFANGLQNGRLGKYATDPDYITKLTSMFNSIVTDYKQTLNADLQHNNGLIKQYQSEIDNLREMGNDDTNPIIFNNMQKIEGIRNKNISIEKDIKSLNDLK